MYTRRYYFLLKEVEKVLEPRELTQSREGLDRTRKSGWSTSSKPDKKGYLNDTYCSKRGTLPKKAPKKTRASSKFAQALEPEWISGLIKRYSA